MVIWLPYIRKPAKMPELNLLFRLRSYIGEKMDISPNKSRNYP